MVSHPATIPAFLLATLFTTSARTARLSERLYRDGAQILGGRANIVSRWTGPIRFRSVGNAISDETAFRIIAQAAATAGLELTFNKRSEVGIASTLRRFPECRKLGSQGAFSPDCFNFLVVVADPRTVQQLANLAPQR